MICILCATEFEVNKYWMNVIIMFQNCLHLSREVTSLIAKFYRIHVCLFVVCCQNLWQEGKAAMESDVEFLNRQWKVSDRILPQQCLRLERMASYCCKNYTRVNKMYLNACLYIVYCLEWARGLKVGKFAVYFREQP